MNSKRSLADKISDGKVQTRLVKLTSAQVKALRATPITLVTGVAGKVIRFVGAELRLGYGGTNGFTESTANFAVKFTNGSGVAVSDTVENTGFIDQTANTVTNAVPVKDNIAASTGAVGQSLVLHNIGAGEIGGNAANDNTLSIEVSYILAQFK